MNVSTIWNPSARAWENPSPRRRCRRESVQKVASARRAARHASSALSSSPCMVVVSGTGSAALT
ncbi:MAG: hypothetical protein L0H64_20475 [Pseudonocardia sp.]|nr:hypothetical protein [Pseudonocardia sp.]